MKEKFMKSAETFSKAMVQPIMSLSVVGLIVTFGVLTTNPNMVKMLPFLSNDFIRIPMTMMYEAMLFVINNLSVIFCVGLAAAIGKVEKAQCSIVALISYMSYLVCSNQFLKLTDTLVEPAKVFGSGQAMIFGLQVTDTGVFAGMLLGVLIGLVHRKTVKVNFKGALALYSSSRLTLLVAIPMTALLAIVISLGWPAVQGVIRHAATFISGSGIFGLFTFGFLDRILIPTGLHHLVYMPLFYSELGGVIQMGSETIAGVIPIAMAEMKNPEVLQFSSSILFTTVGLAKVFGLSGAALAMYKTAKPELKNKAKGILLPAVFTSVLVGMTEPLEFAFLFCAPLLFLIHAIFTGLGMVALSVLGVTANGSAGAINFIVTNVVAGVEKTGWPMYVLVGIVMFAVYYFTFKFLIVKLNLHTPGREKEKTDENPESSITKTKKEFSSNEKAVCIIDGLGGKGNITTVDNCFTRLRVSVIDIELVNDDLINQISNSGIVRKGNDIQIIYGLDVGQMRKIVDEELNLNTITQ